MAYFQKHPLVYKEAPADSVKMNEEFQQVYVAINDLDARTTMAGAPDFATATPLMDGVGAVGTTSKIAREDHVHPANTGKADSDHVHGNIANDGTVGSTPGLPLVTGTGGAVSAGTFGTTAGSVCEGNDSRLSDARTPTAHGNEKHSSAFITSAGVTYENLNTNGDVGSAPGTVCSGDDSRLSDSRTPTAHGNDKHTSAFITSSGVTYENMSANGDVGTAANTLCAGDDSRLSDSRTPTSHGNEVHSSPFITASGVTYENLNSIGDVGSSAGTVCAGDDVRLSDSRDPNAHGNEAHSSSFITTAGVTYEALSTNGDIGTTASTLCAGNDARLSDARTPTAHAGAHTNGTDDIQSATALQKGLMTTAYASKLNGIETGADVTDAENIASSVSGANEKGTPVNADTLLLLDSEALGVLKKISFEALAGAISTASSGDMTKAVYDPTGKNADAFSCDNHASGTTNKVYTATEQTKLSGIEQGADVTDAANVAAAGAIMDGDFTSNGLMKRTGAGTYGVDASSYITSAGVTYENLNTNGDVGSAAGTVCAGNDARLSDSREPTSHGNDKHTSAFITSTGVTYEALNTNGDVGNIPGTVCAGDDARLSDSRTPASHGNEKHTSTFITSGGVTFEALNANGDVGSAASTLCAGDDSRLSDARTPTAHGNDKHSATYITTAGVTYEALNGNSDIGTTSGTVCAGDDSRLSDSRTPKTHASTHTNGTDDIQSANSAQKGLMTSTYASKLDGIEASADVTDAGNVGSTIHGATEKTSLVDNDELGLIDSEASNALKRLKISTLRADFGLITEIVKSSTATLTAAEVSGTIINNYGQSADAVLTLPTAAKGMNILVVLGTTVAKYYRIKAGTNDKIYLAGTGGTDNGYVGIASATIGASISFAAFQTGTSTYDWMATVVSGTWAAG